MYHREASLYVPHSTKVNYKPELMLPVSALNINMLLFHLIMSNDVGVIIQQKPINMNPFVNFSTVGQI